MINTILKILPFVIVFATGSCVAQKAPTGNKQTSLCKAFKKDFLIGAAINAQQTEEKDTAAARVIAEQFDAVTPENIMKAAIIHPGWNSYNFTLADKLVDYADKNHLLINAHNLIWHSQLPTFVRSLKNADSVRQYFTNHINTVAARYDGKVYSWDVVNEALNEDGTMRKSIFLQQLGDDYVVEAFRLAQQGGPAYQTLLQRLQH